MVALVDEDAVADRHAEAFVAFREDEIERVVALAEALRFFDRKMRGFVSEEAVLIAPESRTSSPVRIERNEACESPSLPGLFPAGEGAGFAGGIVSASLDGLRVARAVRARLAGEAPPTETARLVSGPEY